jgi:hypothetical protein
MDDTEAL